MKSYFKEALQTGVSAAKKNARSGITLQVLALALILGYYSIASFRAKLDVLGELNTNWSPWFGIILTMIFGGAIPLTIEFFQRRKKAQGQRSVLEVLFTLLLWAVNGYMVCWFYELQAGLFGNDQKVSTVIKKVLVDQFIYVPVYVIPVFTYLFLWRDNEFSLSETKLALKEKGFLARGVPLMISNWAVWIPAVCIIYSFPLPLQLILMNLILVFWSLILTFFVSEE